MTQPTADRADELGDDLEDDAPAATAWSGPTRGRWAIFTLLAIAVVAVDQVAKAWIVGSLAVGTGYQVLGDWLRVVHGRNSGILFGMLPQSAPAFAIVSLVVMVLIVVYHARVGRGILTTVALGLLLGGALGNMLDRVRFGSVIDWIDMGIGSARFWTYNLGDAAITTAILLLIAMAAFPVIAGWGSDD